MEKYCWKWKAQKVDFIVTLRKPTGNLVFFTRQNKTQKHGTHHSTKLLRSTQPNICHTSLSRGSGLAHRRSTCFHRPQAVNCKEKKIRKKLELRFYLFNLPHLGNTWAIVFVFVSQTGGCLGSSWTSEAWTWSFTASL
jgi:hypothetical protein